MAKGEKSKEKSLPTTKSAGSMAVEVGGGKKGMVILRSEDGKEFVMSEEEARNCGRTVHVMMKYDSESHIVPSDDGREIRCCLVRLSVQGDTLSKVVDFSNKRGLDLTWDDDNFDHDPAAFFDLILVPLPSFLSPCFVVISVPKHLLLFRLAPSFMLVCHHVFRFLMLLAL